MNSVEVARDLSIFCLGLPFTEKAMKVLKFVLDATQFVFDGFFEIFSDTDDYPMVGLQPFEGDIR